MSWMLGKVSEIAVLGVTREDPGSKIPTSEPARVCGVVLAVEIVKLGMAGL